MRHVLISRSGRQLMGSSRCTCDKMGTSCSLSPLPAYHTHEGKPPPKPLTLHSPRSPPVRTPHGRQNAQAPKLRAGRADPPLRRAGSRRSPQLPRGLPTGPPQRECSWDTVGSRRRPGPHPTCPGGTPRPGLRPPPRHRPAPAPSPGLRSRGSGLSQITARSASRLPASLSTSFSRARPCEPGARTPPGPLRTPQAGPRPRAARPPRFRHQQPAAGSPRAHTRRRRPGLLSPRGEEADLSPRGAREPGGSRQTTAPPGVGWKMAPGSPSIAFRGRKEPVEQRNLCVFLGGGGGSMEGALEAGAPPGEARPGRRDDGALARRPAPLGSRPRRPFLCLRFPLGLRGRETRPRAPGSGWW